MRALASEPSLNETLSSPDPPATATTWLFVRILPSRLRMIPEPEPWPFGPLTLIMTTEGSTLWATFSIEPVAAACAVVPPVWVSTGEDRTSSCVDVQTAAPPAPAAPPTSRLAATTVAASPRPRGPLRERRSGGRTGVVTSRPPVGRRSPGWVAYPYGDQVPGGAGGSWPHSCRLSGPLRSYGSFAMAPTVPGKPGRTLR